MKGVILTIAPGTKIADICHNVPAGDIAAGAFCMREVCRWFPPGTVHVGVVDPGVGGERAALAVKSERYLFVGPDNGLLAGACGEDGIEKIVRIENPAFMLDEISHTFHGRDVFAPAAAHLARGEDIAELGPQVQRMAELPLQPPLRKGGFIHGEVVYIDGFGNLITNIPGPTVSSRRHEVRVGDRAIASVSTSYVAVDEGEPLALIGSGGFLEISVRGGSAAERLGAQRGSAVHVREITTDSPGKGKGKK